jgi:diguanylate cyclase (GGDEF)-like protein
VETAVVVLLAAAVAGLAGWLLARVAARTREQQTERERWRIRERLDEVEAELREERSAHGAAADAAEQAVARAEELERRADRLEHARDLERRWNHELRERLYELQTARGLLGDTSDVRELVLHLALTLLGADKGMLISREDENHDGDLDLVCAEGFENDAEGSAVAQHFAGRVLDRDETVRADDPEELELGERTAADAEIDNLVAIPIYMRDHFHGVVIAANKPGGFTDEDDDVLLALGDHAGFALQNARLRGAVRGSLLATVRVLVDAIEAKDRELRAHSDDVSRYVAAVATQMGIEPRQREDLVFASLLHDVGKIGISERILLKPGPLTPEERAVVQTHSRIGARLVEQVPALQEIAPAILHHHERWDGEGYPAGLRGEQIPLEARIIGVVDAFASMLADRPYREALSLEEACDELKRCAGTQFDPTVVRLFVEEIRRRPPGSPGERDSLTTALADPELASRVPEEGRLLGAGAFSTVDNLTLLYCHRYLHETAHAEAERADVQGKPFAVIVVELTRLAQTNRDAGYAAGDEAILAAAEAVQRVARRCGGTAARESGKRVCLLVPGADEATAERLADDVLAELEDAGSVRITCAVWQQGDSGDDVIARARRSALQHSVTRQG